nr:hypothetical protein [Tanacetum cinerariifolium]
LSAVPPTKARKFKKPASPKLSNVLVSPEEPTRKSKRVKRPAKKSTNAPIGGVVIRELLNEGGDRESNSGDDNTQSDNEKGSDFEYETDKNETGSESDK